ncbi:MAG TPA: hypothetical protein VMB81_19500 [Candidatus Sulfotelmatobacter sp.]|nr:hypothetical protein [Candidatus Sulfotelmatobacter sp.]
MVVRSSHRPAAIAADRRFASLMLAVLVAIPAIQLIVTLIVTRAAG